MTGPIVSFHPAIEAEENLLLTSQRPLDANDRAAVSRAAAVVLPQICRPDLYSLVAGLNKPHFPRPKTQLTLDGKVGNFRLFQSLNLPQPRGIVFEGLEQAVSAWRRGDTQKVGLLPPLVVKGAGGGEGKNVFLVASSEELADLQGLLETACLNGPAGLVLQEYVECNGRDARVVIIGQWEDAFWRVAPPGEFRSNLSQGGRVDRDSRAEDLAKVRSLARRLKEAAGLDLAAVDILAPKGGEPMLLEINFYFGRRALGGSGPFLEILLKAARGWLSGLGLDSQKARLAF